MAMRCRIRHIGLGIIALLIAALAQSPQSSDTCCYTPARGPSCPAVRFGWGNCPGSRLACDWCYGPSGVFAYSPRGSVYTLDSGCKHLGSKTIWVAKDSLTAQSMIKAGGNCTSNGRGYFNCMNVNAGRFKHVANCGSQ